jgi:hypothetical protein
MSVSRSARTRESFSRFTVRTALLLTTGVVCVGLPSVSRGDEPDESRAQARALTSAGAAAYKAEQYVEAVNKFSAAYRLYPAPTLLLNISRAQLKLGRCREAIHYADLFKAALSESQAASPDSPDAWQDTVQRTCIEAEVDSSPSGATIWIDGERQIAPDKTPWTGRLPVGRHKVLVWLQGYQKQEGFLSVTADSPTRLSLALSPWNSATPEPSAAVPAIAPSAPLPAVASGTPGQPIRLVPASDATAGTELNAAKAASNPTLRRTGFAGIAIGSAALVTALALGVTLLNGNAAAGKVTGPRTVAQANAELSTSASEAAGTQALLAIGGVFVAAGVPLAVVF